MCFQIHSDHKEIKTAEEDITCYKVLRRTGKPFLQFFGLGKYEAPFQDTPYKLKQLNKVELESPRAGMIEIGLHSLITMAEAVRLINLCWGPEVEKYKIMKAIIPKGSEYYVNPVREEYVSNQLIVIKRIKL